MGQEVGPASLVWRKAPSIAQTPPACRNLAEWHRQQRLIWALGSTPGAWVSQVVKEGRGHGFYYSNPASQPGELSGWTTFPSLLFDYFAPFSPSNHLPILTSCLISPWLSRSLISASPKPQCWILLHIPSLFSFLGKLNFPCLFPKCSSSVYFLDPVFSSFLSFQIFSLHEIILNPLEALSYLPPLKITIIPNQWLLQLLFSSPRDFCMGYFPIVLSLFYTCTTTWTVNQSSLKPFCCCIQSPYFKVNRRGKCGNSDRFYFLELPNQCSWWLQLWNEKMLAPWKKSYDKPKKQRHLFADKGLYSQSYDFSSSHVGMWELGHKKGWASKNWHFWTMVLENTLESPLDCKEIKPVSPNVNQLWIFIERTVVETEAPILWPSDEKSQLIGKYLNAGKDWGQEEKVATGDEMIGWHHQLNGHEFEQTLGDSRGQRNLVCYSPWGGKELDTI